MITLRDLLPHLQGLKRYSGGLMARCPMPSHEDKTPSLSVRERDGKLLAYCHGCKADLPQVLNALNLLSIDGPRGDRVYDYRDAAGELRYQVVRSEGKKFTQRRPDGQGGWVWKLDGVRRLPYRLPELLKSDPAKTVYIVEGEKDVDVLRRAGAIATCNSGGAGKWRDDYNEALRGRNVAILPDNDKPGLEHAQKVARALHGIAASVKIVELPGLKESEDVSDWLSRGNTLAQLKTLSQRAFPLVPHSEDDSKPILKSYADFMSEVTNDGEVIAFECCQGEVALISSVTNKGKSTLIRNAAFCLATGRDFLTLATGGAERRVLLVNFEGAKGRFRADLHVMERIFDDSEMARVRANLIVAHAPEIDDEPLSLSWHMNLFENEARAVAPDVIFIDTVSAAFSIRSESDNSEVAALMKRLTRLARRLNCVIVIVHHIGKAKSEEGLTREPAHRSRGASAWGDASSAIFNLECGQSDSDISTLTCGKRKTGTGQNYEITLKLDRDSRWFSPTNQAAPRLLTNREQVLRVLSPTETLPTRGVEQLLAGKCSAKTVRNQLKQLVKDGLATQPKRGFWLLWKAVQAEPTNEAR